MTTTATEINECGECRRTFATMAEVFSHECRALDLGPVRRHFGDVVEVRGDRQVVANGFGGTTTRTHTSTTTVLPATDKQKAFLRTLLAERAGVAAAESVRVTLNVAREAGTLDRRTASAAIDLLLKIARAEAPAAAPAPVVTSVPEVEEGHYAIRVDGIVKFYRIDRPAEGKWAGYTFVKVQASDDLYPVRGEARRPILEAIAADPAAASALYGHELGRCGVCNRTLTDEDSRARGIGPVCAQKRGW